jgi:hypothetical protein
MALKLLNPGLRPLGMFDLEDDDAGTLEGGEYVALVADTDDDGYAADVGGHGPFIGADLTDPNRIAVRFSVGVCTDSILGGLADEGEDQYGTLFGQLIGQNAGRATVESGAVVIGPSTDRASGKVTVWAAPGLYGVNGAAANDGDATLNLGAYTTVNTPVLANTSGLLGNTGGTIGGQALGLFVGHMTDQSLVSTTNTAAGEARTVDHSALYFTGTQI